MLVSFVAIYIVYIGSNKLNVCVSHTTTIKTLVELGIDNDKRIKEWRDDLEKGMC